MSTYEVTATSPNRERRVIEMEEARNASEAIESAKEHLRRNHAFLEQWDDDDVERGEFVADFIPRDHRVILHPGFDSR